MSMAHEKPSSSKLHLTFKTLVISYELSIAANSCRWEACRLHVDIVMSLGDIFGYISDGFGWKLAERWGMGKSDPVKFSARWLQEPQRKGQNTNLFRDKYHVPRSTHQFDHSTLPISAKLDRNMWIHVPVNPFVAKFWKFSVKGSLFFQKTIFLSLFGSFQKLLGSVT